MIEQSVKPPEGAADVLHRLLRHAVDRGWSHEPAAVAFDGLVRVPPGAADDPAVAADLVAGGLRTAYVDCRRGGPSTWRAMVTNVRRAASDGQVSVRVMMDLTGAALGQPFGPAGRCAVLHLQPAGAGEHVQPALAQLVSSPDDGAQLELDRIVLPTGFLAHLVPGDRVDLVDAHAKRRKLRVIGVNEWGAVVRAKRAVTLVEGTVVHFGRKNGTITALVEGSGTPPQGRDLPAIISLADLIALPMPAHEPPGALPAPPGPAQPLLRWSPADVLVVETGSVLRGSLDRLLGTLGPTEPLLVAGAQVPSLRP